MPALDGKQQGRQHAEWPGSRPRSHFALAHSRKVRNNGRPPETLVLRGFLSIFLPGASSDTQTAQSRRIPGRRDEEGLFGREA